MLSPNYLRFLFYEETTVEFQSISFAFFLFSLSLIINATRVRGIKSARNTPTRRARRIKLRELRKFSRWKYWHLLPTWRMNFRRRSRRIWSTCVCWSIANPFIRSPRLSRGERKMIKISTCPENFAEVRNRCGGYRRNALHTLIAPASVK